MAFVNQALVYSLPPTDVHRGTQVYSPVDLGGKKEFKEIHAEGFLWFSTLPFPHFTPHSTPPPGTHCEQTPGGENREGVGSTRGYIHVLMGLGRLK
jgi:hypothetical protein